MDEFSSIIKNRYVTVENAADAVRFSTIVQNSISYLDLRVSKNSPSEIFYGNNTDVVNLHTFANTEEKIRKLFTPSRNLLYILHLDLCKGREYDLKNDLDPYILSRDPNIPHIAKISLCDGFYVMTMLDFIHCALNVFDQKLKILELILKIPFLKKYFLNESNIVNIFIDSFYPNTTDSKFLEPFIKNFDLPQWITLSEKPQVLSFLLHNARIYDRDFEEEGLNFDEIIFFCISLSFYSNISPILNYIDTPKFSSEASKWYIYEISLLRPDLSEEVATKCLKGMKSDRIGLMLITVWIFLLSSRRNCTEGASEALRLLWNSSHHVNLSFEEITNVFSSGLREKELLDMYDFYSNCVGHNGSNDAPRPLKHYCRVFIRKSLAMKKIWIPDGIKQLGLPSSLESFLNIEK